MAALLTNGAPVRKRNASLLLLALGGCCFNGGVEASGDTGTTGTAATSTGTSGTSSTGSGGTSSGGCSYPTAAALAAGTATWRDQCDAGQCTDDTQCASGFSCGLTVDLCTAGNPSLGVIASGTCRVSFQTDDASCTVGEDCGQGLCLARPGTNATCTLANPCPSGGVCGGSTEPMPPTCPAGCGPEILPYSTLYACICPGTACDAG